MSYKDEVEKRLLELSEAKRELEKKLFPIQEEYNALSNLLNIINKSSEDVYASASYPSEGTLEERIKFVLSQIKEGSAEQIRGEMLKYEKQVSPNSVTNTSSTMYKNGELKIRKDGKKYIYRLE